MAAETRPKAAFAGKRPRNLLLILLALTIAIPPIQHAQATSPVFQYKRQWGGPGGPTSPNMIAIDASGTIYITDSVNLAVARIARNGTFLGFWGTSGQFNNPMGIAVDNPHGYVYVTDSANNNVYKYNTAGTLLATWNSNGNGTQNGKFNHPQGVAVNSTGYVYIVDQGNARIGIFSSAGTFVKYFPLATPGNFLDAVGIAIDQQGLVYVDDPSTSLSDAFAGNITQFTKNGSFQMTWDGPIFLPQQLAVDNSSNIYAADSLNDKVQKFNINNQNVVLTIGTQGSGPGQFSNAVAVALDGLGNIFVGDNSNLNIQKFSASTGTYLATIRYQQAGKFSTPNGAAIDSQGNIYVVDSDNARVQEFNSTGTFITGWGTYGNLPGQFNGPNSIAIDHNGKIYITDNGNGRVEKFQPDGTFLASWNLTYTLGVDLPPSPVGIAIDSTNHVYVTDSANNRVEKFDSSGNFVSKFGSYGSQNGNFSSPLGIAIDTANNIYVVDFGNNRIEKFNSANTFLAGWGSAGTGTNQFNGPNGIGLDSAGNIYVADTFNNRVEAFYANRTFLTTIGSKGSGNGQFAYPNSVAINGQDNLYVTDSNSTLAGTPNNRIEVFAPTHDPAATRLTISRTTSYYGVTLAPSNPIEMNITLSNYGLSSESLWVRELANQTIIIGQQNITLTPGQTTTIPFAWFPNLTTGTYNITAQVQPVSGDPNQTNNMVQGGLFYVRNKGDVNGDKCVNIIDLATVGTTFGKSTGQSGYNIAADQNNDGTINIVDLVFVATSFGTGVGTYC